MSSIPNCFGIIFFLLYLYNKPIYMPNKQRLLLPRTNIVGKEPIPSEMLYGELYVNYASGDGTSFLVTKNSRTLLDRYCV